jgi:hypothetical protein
MDKNQSKNVHVIKRNGGWVVRGESIKSVKSIHTTQSDAIEAARIIAKNEKGELIIHGSDGRIRDRARYYSEAVLPKLPRKVLYPKSINKSEERKIQEAIKAVINERKDAVNQ